MRSILEIIQKRLAIGLLALLVVTLIFFSALELLPGDIATEKLGQSATPETVAAFREQLGLSDPAPVRYWNWLTGALAGDFRTSLATQRPIADLISTRAINTFFLATYAGAIAIPLAVLFGALAALYRNSAFDRFTFIATLSAISFPEFFVAYILILLFTVQLGWFPSLVSVDSDTPFSERLYQIFLSALNMTVIVMAHMLRMTRAAIINLLALPYVEMAHL